MLLKAQLRRVQQQLQVAVLRQVAIQWVCIINELYNLFYRYFLDEQFNVDNKNKFINQQHIKLKYNILNKFNKWWSFRNKDFDRWKWRHSWLILFSFSVGQTTTTTTTTRTTTSEFSHSSSLSFEKISYDCSDDNDDDNNRFVISLENRRRNPTIDYKF